MRKRKIIIEQIALKQADSIIRSEKTDQAFDDFHIFYSLSQILKDMANLLKL
jgi:hypothetical protein